MTPDFVKPGATVVDVGINRVTDAALARSLFEPDSPRLADFEKRGSVVVGDVHPRVADRCRRVDAGAGRRRAADRRDAAQEHGDRRQGSRRASEMVRAALTGGIATGKSYCLGRFAALGAATIDADQLARRGRRARHARPAARRRALRPRHPAPRRHPRSSRPRPHRLRRPRRPRRPRGHHPPRGLPADRRVVRQPASRHSRRNRRHPAAVRDRPGTRLRSCHRRGLRPRRTAAPSHGPRRPSTSLQPAPASTRSGRSTPRSRAPTTSSAPTAAFPKPICRPASLREPLGRKFEGRGSEVQREARAKSTETNGREQADSGR